MSKPDFEHMPKEEIDEFLRDHGYDPDKVGYTGGIFTNVLMENIHLKDQITELEAGRDAAIGLLEDAQGEWLPVEIPYCPESVATLREIVAVLK